MQQRRSGVVFFYTVLGQGTGRRIKFSAGTDSYSSKAGQTANAPFA